MQSNGLDIRKPAVAGMFYPGEPSELVRVIAGFFSEVEKVPLSGRPMALISPHAGYPYSGRVAAKAYKLLEGEQYDTVVVVSPSHTVFFKGSAVFEGGGYETPLGVAENDPHLAKRLASISPSVYFSKMGHASGATRGEHALEVQLPFMQVVLGRFKLVAVVMGDQEEDSIRTLGETLASAVAGTNTLLVASTDLSHFHSQKTAHRLDGQVREAIERNDPDLLIEMLSSGKGEACGGGPVAATLIACRRLGAASVQVIEYATSGETTGDFDEVVGYLSAAVVAGAGAKTGRHEIGSMPAGARKEFALSEEDKQQLHQIARDAIAAKLRDKPYAAPKSGRLSAERGAFVTIKVDGHLRGCIGQVRGFQPLYRTIAEMAVAAAFEDPRFPPLTPQEHARLEYEISVLSPLERVHDFNVIEIGRDGLMVKMDMHSGLLLPQVALEYGWDVTEFLQQTCLKAGLPKNSYRDKNTEVYRFSAMVF